MNTLRFPPEVLSEIFLNSLELQWESGFLPRIHPDHTPVLLTRICSYWRDVALSDPRLWSRMSLPDLPPTRSQRNSLLKQVPFWLSLSGSIPLSITLRISGQFPAFAPKYATLLHRESHRWESVRLFLGVVKVEALPPVGSMALLREFSYEGISNKISDVISPFMTSFVSAPHLRRVTIKDDMAWAWALPWANLTNLTIVCETVSCPPDMMSQICENLQACVCLESLNLTFRLFPDEPFLTSRVPIMLPRLMRFSLEADMPESVGSFMHTLVVPRLDEFRFIAYGYRSADDALSPYEQIITSILSFLDLNGGQINTLWLNMYALLDTDLVRVLQRVPNLDTLDIQDKDLTPLVLNALTIHYDSQGRVQAGQNLRLTDICCVPPSRDLDGCDYTAVLPCLPLSFDASPGVAGSLGVPGTATRQITFTGDPLPAEKDVHLDVMYQWLVKVSNPEFCISFARMIHSRWSLPPNARAEGKVVQLTGMRLVHFDLHIVETISRGWYTALLKYWKEGLRLDVWCSLKRQAYWRHMYHSRMARQPAR